MPKQLTVCFQLKDNDESKKLIEDLRERFAIGEQQVKDMAYSVSAMSIDDEFHRLELIEQAAEQGSSLEAMDQVREILSLASFEGIKSIDDLAQ